MAEEETRQCSSCGTDVPVSENECPYCGLNLDTGESFQMRVRKSKQDREHQAVPLSSVLMLPIIAFALAVFAGYMYQRQAESTLQKSRDLVQPYVEKLRKVDVLTRFGQVEKARELCQQVVENTKSEAESLGGGRTASEDEQEHIQAQKSLLLSIRSKALHKKEDLSQ